MTDKAEDKMNDDPLEEMAREIVEKVMPNIHVEDWDDSVGGAIRSWPGKEMQEVIEFEFEEAITEALYTLRSKTRKEDAEKLKIAVDVINKSLAWLKAVEESGVRYICLGARGTREEFEKALQAILKKDEEEK